MKNKKLKRNEPKKKLLLLGALLLAGVLAGIGYFKFIKDDSAALNQEEQKSAEQADVDSAKQRVEEETEGEPLKDGDKTGEPPIVSGPVALSGLSFSQGSGLVNSSVRVSGAGSGTCTFIYTDGDGRAISKTATLASGGCSISVSEAEFTMIGEYNLTAKFSDKSASKTVNIE